MQYNNQMLIITIRIMSLNWADDLTVTSLYITLEEASEWYFSSSMDEHAAMFCQNLG